MNDLQKKIYDILIWFDGFCKQHNLRYFLAGGTELGAIRHQGFIPWDDDADVIMPRPDYMRFIELTKENLYFGKYFVESPYSSDDDYFYLYAKVFDLNTTLVENTRYGFVRGVYLDIFPLDGFGQDEQHAKKNGKKILRAVLWNKALNGGRRPGRAWYKQFVIDVLKIFKPSKRKCLKADEKCSKLAYDECTIIGNPHGAWLEKEIMPRKILGQGREVLFENATLLGADDADAYLSHLYGEYMKLPPIEKQVSHHDFLELDLNRSFTEHPEYKGKWRSTDTN